MKKNSLLCLIVCLFLILTVSFCACNKSDGDGNNANTIGDVDTRGSLNIDESLTKYNADIKSELFDAYKTILTAYYTYTNNAEEIQYIKKSYNELTATETVYFEKIEKILLDGKVSENAVHSLISYVKENVSFIKDLIPNGKWGDIVISEQNITKAKQIYSKMIELTGAEVFCRVGIEAGKLGLSLAQEDCEESISDNRKNLDNIIASYRLDSAKAKSALEQIFNYEKEIDDLEDDYYKYYYYNDSSYTNDYEYYYDLKKMVDDKVLGTSEANNIAKQAKAKYDEFLSKKNVIDNKIQQIYNEYDGIEDCYYTYRNIMSSTDDLNVIKAAKSLLNSADKVSGYISDMVDILVSFLDVTILLAKDVNSTKAATIGEKFMNEDFTFTVSDYKDLIVPLLNTIGGQNSKEGFLNLIDFIVENKADVFTIIKKFNLNSVELLVNSIDRYLSDEYIRIAKSTVDELYNFIPDALTKVPDNLVQAVIDFTKGYESDYEYFSREYDYDSGEYKYYRGENEITQKEYEQYAALAVSNYYNGFGLKVYKHNGRVITQFEYAKAAAKLLQNVFDYVLTLENKFTSTLENNIYTVISILNDECDYNVYTIEDKCNLKISDLFDALEDFTKANIDGAKNIAEIENIYQTCLTDSINSFLKDRLPNLYY